MGIIRKAHEHRLPGRPFPGKRWGKTIKDLLADGADEIDMGQAVGQFFAEDQPNGYQPHFFAFDFGAGAFTPPAPMQTPLEAFNAKVLAEIAEDERLHP